MEGKRVDDDKERGTRNGEGELIRRRDETAKQ